MMYLASNIHIFIHFPAHFGSVEGPSPGIWGGSQIGGAENVFTCLNTKGLSATIDWVSHKLVTFCRPKSSYFCWSNYAILQEITSLKALYIINSENVWSWSQTVGLSFHKLHISRISTKCI